MATTLVVGDGGPLGAGLTTAGAVSYALGDVQIYSTDIDLPNQQLWSGTNVPLSYNNATLSPPPPFVALSGAIRTTACTGNFAPFSRYGGGGAYPVVGGIALDFGFLGNPADLIMPGRALTLLGSLNFNVARALDLGPTTTLFDLSSTSNYPTFTIVVMSDSALCSSAPLFDIAGYSAHVVVGGTGNCAALATLSALPQIVVYGPLGQTAILTGANTTLVPLLPTAKANVYWAISLTSTGVTVYYDGRPWATSTSVKWDSPMATERNVIFGYGNLLDVQLYDLPQVNIPVAMRKISLGLSGGCGVPAATGR
jgi:hypothetical protein